MGQNLLHQLKPIDALDLFPSSPESVIVRGPDMTTKSAKIQRILKRLVFETQLPGILGQPQGQPPTPPVHSGVAPSNSTPVDQAPPVQQRPVNPVQSKIARVRELREQIIALNDSDRAIIQNSRKLLEDELKEELERR
ncbi:MAG: hypothetical protein Q9203_002657 [Teloschistes exilis]